MSQFSLSGKLMYKNKNSWPVDLQEDNKENNRYVEQLFNSDINNTGDGNNRKKNIGGNSKEKN